MEVQIDARRISRWLANTLIAIPLLSGNLNAQDSSRTRAGWLTAISIGVPGYEHEAVPELFTLGANFTQNRPGNVALDFSLGTMPRLFVEGVAVVGARGGLAIPVALTPNFLLVPSTGVSAIGGAGSGGGGGVFGLNGGIAAIILGKDASGVRVGMTWHSFEDMRGALWLFEFGVLPGRRKSAH